MRVSRSSRELSVFAIKANDLERLVESLGPHFPSLTAVATCSDELTRTFETFSELRDYRNPLRSEILGLEIRAHDFERRHSLRLSFESNDYANASITLDADEEISLKVNDIYTDFLDSVRPWYSWLAKSDWVLILGGSLVLFYMFAVGYVFTTTGKSPLTLSSDIKFRVGDLAFGIAPLVFGIFINRFRARFFPTATFAIGDGNNRFDKAETVRTVLISGFAISIVTTFALSWV